MMFQWSGDVQGYLVWACPVLAAAAYAFARYWQRRTYRSIARLLRARSRAFDVAAKQNDVAASKAFLLGKVDAYNQAFRLIANQLIDNSIPAPEDVPANLTQSPAPTVDTDQADRTLAVHDAQVSELKARIAELEKRYVELDEQFTNLSRAYSVLRIPLKNAALPSDGKAIVAQIERERQAYKERIAELENALRKLVEPYELGKVPQ